MKWRKILEMFHLGGKTKKKKPVLHPPLNPPESTRVTKIFREDLDRIVNGKKPLLKPVEKAPVVSKPPQVSPLNETTKIDVKDIPLPPLFEDDERTLPGIPSFQEDTERRVQETLAEDPLNQYKNSPEGKESQEILELLQTLKEQEHPSRSDLFHLFVVITQKIKSIEESLFGFSRENSLIGNSKYENLKNGIESLKTELKKVGISSKDLTIIAEKDILKGNSEAFAVAMLDSIKFILESIIAFEADFLHSRQEIEKFENSETINVNDPAEKAKLKEFLRSQGIFFDEE